jgi:hypothetical protein
MTTLKRFEKTNFGTFERTVRKTRNAIFMNNWVNWRFVRISKSRFDSLALA